MDAAFLREGLQWKSHSLTKDDIVKTMGELKQWESRCVHAKA